MVRVLFLIHDLSVGGAEKVLVNLVNHMDREKFDITVISLFGGGVNEQFLAPHIRYRVIWKKMIPANSKIMKLFSPRQLHAMCVKEYYDIEVAYLEGPPARIISGCPNTNTKLFSWIHVEQHTREWASGSFRSYKEAEDCYSRFDKIICVSEFVRKDFLSVFPKIKNIDVVYNTIETEKILLLKDEPVDCFSRNEMNIIGVGKLVPSKGFDKMARILKRLRESGYPVHWYALGVGPEKEKIEMYLKENNLQQYFTFLGYQNNPYKYVSKCDLFVCASMAEGFSTAATEALIVGTPVCTVDVSGMKEMLGEHNEWGMVTENNEDALFEGIEYLLKNNKVLKYYKSKALERGAFFSTKNTVKNTENTLLGL